MPIYEFKCSNCKNNFELILSYKDDINKNKKCPKCKKIKGKRVISKPNVVFVGSGFYKNDHGKGG